MQTIESIIALKTLAEKQLVDINTLLDSMMPELTIKYGDNNIVIRTPRAAYYPKEIEMYYNYEIIRVIFNVSKDKNLSIAKYINDPTKNEAITSRNILDILKDLHRFATNELERQHLRDFAKQLYDRNNVLVDIYNNGPPKALTIPELDQLENFFKQCTTLWRLQLDILRDIDIIRFYAIREQTSELALNELCENIRKWVNTEYRKIFVSIE